MRRAMLIPVTLLALIMALGCKEEPQHAPTRPKAAAKTVVWLPGRATKARESKGTRGNASKPSMSSPPEEQASDAPVTEPPPPPAAKPARKRAPHTDRCGRPLIT